MRFKSVIFAVCALCVACSDPMPDTRMSGDFQVLTYNVRGLSPALIEDRGSQIAAIARGLEVFRADVDAIVALQEVFHPAYYDALSARGVGGYPHVSEIGFTGDRRIGDGLVRLSDFAFSDFRRTAWEACFGTEGAGNDCLADKGFAVARHLLAPGTFVDVYNLHADAGQDPGSRRARTHNIRQLIAAIDTNSPPDRPVVVMGDTNCRYTRANDVAEELLRDAGLTDVWIQLVRGNDVPDKGRRIDSGCDRRTGNPNGPDCELIDKILYRSGTDVSLVPTFYEVRVDLFGDPDDAGLSDHFAVSAGFRYARRSSAHDVTADIGSALPTSAGPVR